MKASVGLTIVLIVVVIAVGVVIGWYAGQRHAAGMPGYGDRMMGGSRTDGGPGMMDGEGGTGTPTPCSR